MKISRLPLFLALFCALNSYGSDTLTLLQCRALAVQNSPLQQKKLYAESINALQVRNLRSNSLPRIQLGGQATWQSDVFGLPFKFPGSEIPEVPKDQYKLSLDVSQKIWDGGADQYLRQQRDLEQALAATQVDVDVFSLRETVTDLYFKALLLQESEAILLLSSKDLEARLKQSEAAVEGGIALRTSTDQVKIQLLKTTQQITGIQADKLALLSILAKWVGRDNADFVLEAPPVKPLQKSAPERPEHALFKLQQRNLQIGKDALHLRNQPRIEAFAQGGIGRPNPFNFFETGFEPFFLIGLKAAWTPVDWGNRKRESQVFDLQLKSIDAQRQFFDQRLEISQLKDQQEAEKWQQQRKQDDAIIALQADIVRRAEAQVQNGVMTMTDYLSQLNLLTQAQLTRKTHELQALQATEMYRAKQKD